MALFSYDINEDGVKELIVGWASGKVGALFTSTSPTGSVGQMCNLLYQ